MSINLINQKLLHTGNQETTEASIYDYKVRVDGLFETYFGDTNLEGVQDAIDKMTKFQEKINSAASTVIADLVKSSNGNQDEVFQRYVEKISEDVEKKLNKMLVHFTSLSEPDTSLKIRSSDVSDIIATNYASGFGNRSSNSWVNSLLSLIVSIPSYRKAYETVANHYAQKNKDPFQQERGLAMLDALLAYDAALKNGHSVHSSVSQNVRLGFHHLFFKGCSPDADHQEDVRDALTLLMEKYQRILESQNHSAPNLSFPLETKRIYKPIGEIGEANPERAYPSIEEDHTSSVLSRDFQITLNIEEGDSFETLFSEFFINPHVGNLGPSVYMLPDGTVQNFELTQIRHQFKAVPKEFLLALTRFGYDEDGNFHKFETPGEVPTTIVMPAHATIKKVKITYDLDAFIVHENDSGSEFENQISGDYICYKKINDQWIEVNDDRITFIETQDIEQIASNGYLFHYSNPKTIKNTNNTNKDAEINRSPVKTTIKSTNRLRLTNTTNSANPFHLDKSVNIETKSSDNPFKDSVLNTTRSTPNPFKDSIINTTKSTPNPFKDSVINTTKSTPNHPFNKGSVINTTQSTTNPFKDSVIKTTESTTNPFKDSVIKTTESTTNPFKDSVIKTTESTTNPFKGSVVNTSTSTNPFKGPVANTATSTNPFFQKK